MDAFESFHRVPAAWLRDTDLAPFTPAYVRRLVERHYAANPGISNGPQQVEGGTGSASKKNQRS